MALAVKSYLHDEPYNKEEIAQLLEMSESELETGVLSENTRDIPQFKLKQRALHVFEGSFVRVGLVWLINYHIFYL